MELPEYDKPPVIEVVCGVFFEPLQPLLVPHFGALWDRYKLTFPNCQEQPPLVTTIEVFGPQPQLSLPSFVEVPPLPRIWFLAEPSNRIIQVQRDAFLFNWRKLKDDDDYPRFVNVIRDFQNHLDVFRDFLKDLNIGEIKITQCELTYVNHVFESNGWSQRKSLGAIFPDFLWREMGNRFLPIYEGANWRTSFRMPEQSGRLHATVQIARRISDEKPLVVFELKARGLSKEQDGGGVRAWFDLAHEWIVRGFTDLTSDSLHNFWVRRA